MTRMIDPYVFRRVILLAGAAALVVLAGLGLLNCRIAYWEGTGDMDIEFTVTDVETGLPIKHAVIEVYETNEVARDPDKKVMDLVTDSEGAVKHR